MLYIRNMWFKKVQKWSREQTSNDIIAGNCLFPSRPGVSTWLEALMNGLLIHLAQGKMILGKLK